MSDLTVVILTNNKEKNLRKCIESFRGIAKRFVIIDSGSTDRTEEFCKQLDKEFFIGLLLQQRDFLCQSAQLGIREHQHNHRAVNAYGCR